MYFFQMIYVIDYFVYIHCALLFYIYIPVQYYAITHLGIIFLQI